ncbi:MAG: S24/S26 family peptidase [Prevotella sp.]
MTEECYHDQHIEIKELVFNNKEFLPEVVKLLNQGHTVTLPLKGYSMRPFLENNRDKALLTKAEDIKIGDAVLAEIKPGIFVLHRIIKIVDTQIILQGDGNLNTEQCTLDDVKGSVIGFYRKGRSKIDLTSGLKWRLYSSIWVSLSPIRRYLLFLYRKLCV